LRQTASGGGTSRMKCGVDDFAPWMYKQR